MFESSISIHLCTYLFLCPYLVTIALYPILNSNPSSILHSGCSGLQRPPFLSLWCWQHTHFVSKTQASSIPQLFLSLGLAHGSRIFKILGSPSNRAAPPPIFSTGISLVTHTLLHSNKPLTFFLIPSILGLILQLRWSLHQWPFLTSYDAKPQHLFMAHSGSQKWYHLLNS